MGVRITTILLGAVLGLSAACAGTPTPQSSGSPTNTLKAGLCASCNVWRSLRTPLSTTRCWMSVSSRFAAARASWRSRSARVGS